MSVATREDLSGQVRRLEMRAKDRRKAQDGLNAGTLSASERTRLESEIRQCNDDIARLAERVHKTFRQLAAEQTAIEPIKTSADAVTDQAIQKWVLSVKDAVDRHNRSLAGGDEGKVGVAHKDVEKQIQEADRLDGKTRKVIDELVAESEKTRDRAKLLDKQIAEREKQFAQLKAQVDQLKRDREKLKLQQKKLEGAKDQRKRDLDGLLRQRQAAEGSVKRETKPEAKAREQQKVDDLSARVTESEKYIREQIDFRLKECQRIADQLTEEERKLGEARRTCETDLRQLEDERNAMEKRYKELGDRLQKENKRLDDIAQSRGRLEASLRSV